MVCASYRGRGMRAAAIVIGVLLVVPAFARHVPKPAPPKPPANTATLRYPEAPTATVQIQSGATYRLTLTPHPSVHGVVSDIELVLQRQADPANAPNLLDPPGNWPGYQPYIFAATDFKAGAAAALYGASRSICRTASGLAVTIVIQDVATQKVVLEHRFVSMVVAVTVDAAPVVDGQTVCR